MRKNFATDGEMKLYSPCCCFFLELAIAILAGRKTSEHEYYCLFGRTAVAASVVQKGMQMNREEDPNERDTTTFIALVVRWTGEG